MKKIIKYLCSVFLTSFLTGCYISQNGYICGLNNPQMYCDKKIYSELLKPKKMIDSWSFNGKSEEDRLQDWVQCGGNWGGGDGAVPLPNGQRRTTAQIQSESKASFYRIQRCMLKKKYEYIGECYDNEISRPHPACRARRGEPWE